jgi:[ribosomal protein S5]-alanine N-acetyltransferase
MKAPILETDRLILQPLGMIHLSKNYVKWMNDLEVYRYLESGGDYTFEKLQNFLEEQVRKDIFFWAIHLKASGEKHIGNIKIDPINDSEGSGEYGILLGDKAEWGKGYAKEASLKVIEYCFRNIGLSQITLGVVEENIGAVKLYLKMGFRIVERKNNRGIYQRKLCNSFRMVLDNDK